MLFIAKGGGSANKTMLYQQVRCIAKLRGTHHSSCWLKH